MKHRMLRAAIRGAMVFSAAACAAILFPGSGHAFDEHRIFYAGDSGGTYCRDSSSGPDLSAYSLLSRLQQSPPSGFVIEPEAVTVPSVGPCSGASPSASGYGGLKILDWHTPCSDAAGTGVCSWSCGTCPEPACPVNNNGQLFGTTDWCCCGSRRACIDQSDARYIILQMVANDLWQLYRFYGSDVDAVVDEAKALTLYLTGQGRKVIWLSYAPIGYGGIGTAEIGCTSWLGCLNGINSNTEYFYSKFIPWLNSQSNAYFIDFFTYVKNTFGADYTFINQYGFDSIHLKPDGHQIYYEFVSGRLAAIVASPPATTSSTTAATTSAATTSSTTSTLPATTTTSAASTTTTTGCTYALSPTKKNFSAAGGSGKVAVSTQASCPWSAQSMAPAWVIITSGAGGSGSGTVGYTVLANTTRSSRTGTISVAGKVFTVSQSGAKGGK